MYNFSSWRYENVVKWQKKILYEWQHFFKYLERIFHFFLCWNSWTGFFCKVKCSLHCQKRYIIYQGRRASGKSAASSPSLCPFSTKTRINWTYSVDKIIKYVHHLKQVFFHFLVLLFFKLTFHCKSWQGRVLGKLFAVFWEIFRKFMVLWSG